ncbi:WLM-domain-containing protein [Rickenella mellea]|uniref:WLM-domain-containing protein n=1 Tax=Rickenella mellea TaxID=50990 RepID=A0A4Y7QDT2_9AGAM|nr:WLM-domain-containing protein [Rickenella mellea]
MARYNEREANPNKHITFITALPMPGTPEPFSEQDARQLLRALAAQVRPVMKDHGFAVNSFEEYEYNRVFAGRNWNAGEVVELVLRRADGTFETLPWLMSTLCHELAHIKHMNHGPAFQKLWAQLRREVKALQDKGYYGDGYWSSGTRLSDSARVGGHGIENYEMPEYICGGAQTRSRPNTLARKRRRRKNATAGPSTLTGAQVPKKRKAGSRVTAQNAFVGSGRSLNEGASDDDAKAVGSGFRKKAGSKRAREERALAAEKRLKLLQGDTKPKSELADSDFGSDNEDGGESEEDNTAREDETDDIRRRMMRDMMKDDELDSMRQFMAEFLAENSSSTKVEGKVECSSEETKGKAKHGTQDLPSDSKASASSSASQTGSSGRQPKTSSSLGIGNMVKDEISFRKKASLGMIGGRELGSRPADTHRREGWTCAVCTLDNVEDYLACAACNTPRA